MVRIVIVMVALICAVSFSYAASGDVQKAKEPVGAVVETAGVFIGKFTSVVEKSLGGGKKENTLILSDDAGRTKMIPLDPTIQVFDSAAKVATLNQLKPGEKVAVEVGKDKTGAETAKKVTVVK